MSLLDLLRAGNVAEFNAKRPTRTTLDFFAADLAHLSLVDVDLSGANLEKADFSGSDLTGANLMRANLAGADFTEATLDRCRATKARMREAFLGDARAVQGDFSGADLAEADLTGINGRNANFTGARFKEAVLQNAHLVEANLTDARLGDADLRGADLGMATLCGADLHGANLGGARLTGANLTGARMARATLRHADLTDARLANADLSGADLTGSALKNTDFTGADLFDAQVDPDALRTARGHAAEPDIDGDAIEIHVEDPSVAVGTSHVAFVWENADSEDILTLRLAVVERGVDWDARALPMGIASDAVIARSIVATADGFLALFFLDRAGVYEVQPVQIGLDGGRRARAAIRLDYAPAITPLVGTDGDHVYIYGLARGGTLSVHELLDGALHERLRAPAGTWRGFCSRHDAILLGKGGTMARVRPDAIGAIHTVPAGFPGRLQAAAADGDDGVALVWTQKDEQGVHVHAAGLTRTLHEGIDVGSVDLVAGPDGLIAVWMCEDDENIPMYTRWRSDGGTPKRILGEDDIEDLEDIRFVASVTGPAVAMTTMNGECVVVDLSGAQPRVLARVDP